MPKRPWPLPETLDGSSRSLRDLDRAQRVLETLLPATGEILRRHFLSRAFTRTEKASVDFTTGADEEANAFLRQALGHEFPDSAQLSEETAPPDWSALLDAEDVWVIDPLDGTGNFSRGTPHFAISVARVLHGKPSMARSLIR